MSRGRDTSALSVMSRWQSNAISFVEDNFGITPDEWQKDALIALASGDPRAQRIAMKAAKGPGKTAFLAWAIWWFLGTQGEEGEHPKGKATGITEQNLNDNLWPELSKWQKRSDYLTGAFEWSKSRISAKQHPETWFFAKQPWPKSGDVQAQADTLAGLHGKYILFVLDESGGIPSAVMATAEAGLANAEIDGAWAKIIQAGNPTHLVGPLYDACTKHSSLWTVIEITGDPEDPKRSPRIGVEWAKQQIALYGKDNPWVLVNVFGRFPPSSLNVLLGPDEVRAAMKRDLKEDEFSWAQKRLGVDVARFGDDRTVLQRRQGLNARFAPGIMRHQRTTAIAQGVLGVAHGWGHTMMQTFVDDTGGWGKGTVDILIAAGMPVHAVQVHLEALDPRFENIRMEMWWNMAQWVKRGGALPDVPELVEELTTPTYGFSKQGKMILEPKDDIKSKLGRSPDLAEALALTFTMPEMPGMNEEGQLVTAAMGSGKTEGGGDWDPLREER